MKDLTENMSEAEKEYFEKMVKDYMFQGIPKQSAEIEAYGLVMEWRYTKTFFTI